MQRDASHLAALDVDERVVLHVAVLAAAEDRTADHGFLGAVVGVLKGDDGVVREGRFGVVLVQRTLREGADATARAEDHGAVGTQVVVVHLGEELLLLCVAVGVVGALADAAQFDGGGNLVGVVGACGLFHVGALVADPGVALDGDGGLAGALHVVVLYVGLRRGAQVVQHVGAHRG